MNRRAVVWLVPVLLTVHNAEEAIAFRSYLPTLPTLLPAPLASLAARLPYVALLEALIILSALVFVLAFAVDARPRSRSLFWLLMAVEAAIGLNALAHVLSAAFVFRGYGPGIVTALGLDLPFAVYCFIRAYHERWLSPVALCATVPAAFVLHGPVLLAGLWLAMIPSR